MASTYTSKLRLTLPATGDLNGLWGGTVNSEITSLIEQAIAGRAAIVMTDADYTPTALNGTSDEARNMVMRFTGTLTANRNIIVPTQAKLYIVENATTGGFALTVKTAAGSGVSVPSATASLVRCDATNVVGGFNVNVAAAQGVLPVANGGTASTTAAAALVALGERTDATGALVMPSGNTAARPGSPAFGHTRANSQTGAMEWYDGSAWSLVTPGSGEIKMWPVATPPAGHLLCNGAAVSRTTYAVLFAALGGGASVWGLGDGSTTFNVPDLRDRMPIGAGTTYAANASGGSKDAVVVDHTHTINVSNPAHAHTMGGIYALFGAPGVSSVLTQASDQNTGSTATAVTATATNTGVSGTNANLPPYRGVYFIIKT